QDGSSVIISITDTGLGIEHNQAQRRSTAGSGTGLKNVRERLQALYGDQAQLDLFPNEPQGVVARITLPGNSAISENNEIDQP
ncbi:MAG: ATP-binding protein, partial [Pseudomonadales bacterium]|nr:ATP-binding protein [Pseudomonadales bacterium]